jgi:hypothetical protein
MKFQNAATRWSLAIAITVFCCTAGCFPSLDNTDAQNLAAAFAGGVTDGAQGVLDEGVGRPASGAAADEDPWGDIQPLIDVFFAFIDAAVENQVRDTVPASTELR